ncbi:MAG: hemin uptake protein HemP [Pseudomonadota bacterium]
MKPLPSALPRIRSSDLFANKARDLVIEHEGDEYRLHITRLNKLILTK